MGEQKNKKEEKTLEMPVQKMTLAEMVCHNLYVDNFKKEAIVESANFVVDIGYKLGPALEQQDFPKIVTLLSKVYNYFGCYPSESKK